MKNSTKCFWLYVVSLLLTSAIFYGLIRFDAHKDWALVLLIPCVIAWYGLRIWNHMEEKERLKYSNVIYLEKFMYGLPIGLSLGIICVLLFGD